MDLKNKAGLALALAAIFTTGGANLAFAQASSGLTGDNVTAEADGTVTIKPGVKDPVTKELIGTVVIAPGTETLDVATLNPGDNDVIAIENSAGATIVLDKDVEEGASLIINGGTVKMDGGSSSLKLQLGQATVMDTDGVTPVDYIPITANVTADYVLETLAADSTTVIEVGIKTDGTLGNAGTMSIAEADLDGGIIFADPAFDPAGKYGPSQVAIETFADLKGITVPEDIFIDGVLIAGRNSTITIGSKTSDLVDQAIKEIGFDRWGDKDKQYSAAMAFIGRQTIDLALGGLVVDGTLTSAPARDDVLGNITFADNSLTVFDLTGVDNINAALTLEKADVGKGKITIGSTGTVGDGKAAGVYFANAVDGKEYLIFDGADSIIIGGGDATTDDWFGDNLHFSSGLFDGKFINNGDNLVLETTFNADYIDDVVPLAAAGTRDLIYYLFENKLNDYYTNGDWKPETADEKDTVDGFNARNHRGMQYVAYIVDLVASGMISEKEGAALFDGMSQIAVAGGVPYLTSNVITKVSSLIVNHNNMLNATQPAYGNEPGQLGIWATPFYGLSDVDGMSAGRLETGTELSYGGAAFGIDYNLNEAFRLGLALNVGGGTSDSEDKGDFMKTENDFDFFGGSIYGSYSNGAFGLTGDLGYTAVDSEITMAGGPGGAFQGTSGYRADVDSDAFTVGLTGKYRFTAGENLNVAPHLGLRYTKISTDNTTSKMDGEPIYDIDTDDQNLFQIPVGVEFSSNFVTEGGWTITPRADLGVLFTTGDTDVDTRTRYAGTGPYGTPYNAEVVDEAAFSGSLGIKAQADNGLSLGLDYGILAGGNQTDHQFTGMLRFEF